MIPDFWDEFQQLTDSEIILIRFGFGVRLST